MKLLFNSKDEFMEAYKRKFAGEQNKDFSNATDREIYSTLVDLVKDSMNTNWSETIRNYELNDQRQIYYFSMEFLIGKLLKSYLVNLGIYPFAKEAFSDINIDINKIFEKEADPGLGNGGLGRLAACFMDSLSFLGVPGHGNGIRYNYGLFKQKIEDGYQKEVPDNWLKNGYYWENRKPEKAVIVKFKGHVDAIEKNGEYEFELKDYEPILAVPFDVPLLGYNSTGNINNLRLWSAEPYEDAINMDYFNSGDFAAAMSYRSSVEAISYILYPEDGGPSGRELRLKQEYFMVSAGLQSIMNHYKHGGNDPRKFHEKNAIHINDTHPALVIPELMRILIDDEGLSYDDAWNITTKTAFYTNHTILPEAMEKWPIDLGRYLFPRVYQLIEEIDRRYRIEISNRFPYDNDLIDRTAILNNGNIHMAHLAVIGSRAVNGVAALHTDILKNVVLKDYYMIYPDKFHNKTNGVSHRRFMLSSNDSLSSLITKTIGYEWKFHPEKLTSLLDHAKSKKFLDALMKTKNDNKAILTKYIKEKRDIDVSPDAIFDIQVKRFHAYKRQLLNALKVMAIYDELITNPNFDIYPVCVIFAGKAAPGYQFAKLTIKLINTLAEKINNDPKVKGKLKVVFLENFNVTLGEMVYPAADISEQISTASQEASGTGNMKFMMNGAVTIGTMDGANVEIFENVGEENINIFGLSSDEVISYQIHGGYSSSNEYFANTRIKKIVEQLVDGTWSKKDEFRLIYDDLLLHNDQFFLLKDFEGYMEAFLDLCEKYKDKSKWAKMSLANIARSGVFSSDRTIKEYASETWKIEIIDRID